MDIQLYNTLTHSNQLFEPVAAPRVSMYTCGPTVYDFAHIGNFRAFLMADVVRRFLELVGYDVQHVMNITDVGHMTEDQLVDGGGEDKMAVAGQRYLEAKKSGQAPDGAVNNPNDPYQIAAFFTQAFINDAKALGVKVASDPPKHLPHATQHIKQMQAMIAKLLKAGHAYIGPDGAVYFSVESFPDYGRLSGNTLDQLRGGAGGRVQEGNQANKRHPADFLLWKPDDKHLMKWNAPWGAGYPGWHIECSAMALATLSDLAGQELSTIDIHTGGEDNIFPHHECEIAQSCGSTDSKTFANIWMHARFLLVDGEKMSKSKGNFYTVRDVLQGKVLDEKGAPTGRAVDPAVLRYELIRSHYRINLNFTAASLSDSGQAVRKLRQFADTQHKACDGKAAEVGLDHPVLAKFASCLADDLNMSGAIGEVFRWLGEKPSDPSEALGVLKKVDLVLGVLDEADADSGISDNALDADPQELARQLDAARQAKDYATADDIRNQLKNAGYDVQTTPEGTKVHRQLA